MERGGSRGRRRRREGGKEVSRREPGRLHLPPYPGLSAGGGAGAAGPMAGGGGGGRRGREQLELERLGQAARPGSCPPSPPLSACSRQAWSRDNPGFEPEEDAAAAAGPVLEMDVEWGSRAASSLGSAGAAAGGGRRARRGPAGRGVAEGPGRPPGPPDGAAPRRAAWAKRLARRLRGERAPDTHPHPGCAMWLVVIAPLWSSFSSLACFSIHPRIYVSPCPHRLVRILPPTACSFLSPPLCLPGFTPGCFPCREGLGWT